MGDTWLTTSFWSRFTKHRVIAPVASRDPEGFGRALLAEIKRLGPGTVVLAMEDPSLLWAVKNQAALQAAGGILLAPDFATLEIAEDKSRTLEIAEALSLPCPKTWRPDTASEFAKLALSLEPGKFVVKPRSGTGSAGVNYGDSQTENA